MGPVLPGARNTIVAILIVLGASNAMAAASRFFITDSCPPPLFSVCLANIPIYQVGQPIDFWIAAMDSSGHVVNNYVGTAVFSSSDPSVILPPSYTFTPGDNGFAKLTIIFNSVGSTAGPLPQTSNQSISAVDTTNGLSGSASFTLFGSPAPMAVPVLNFATLTLLAVAIGLIGLIALVRRLRDAP